MFKHNLLKELLKSTLQVIINTQRARANNRNCSSVSILLWQKVKRKGISLKEACFSKILDKSRDFLSSFQIIGCTLVLLLWISSDSRDITQTDEKSSLGFCHQRWSKYIKAETKAPQSFNNFPEAFICNIYHRLEFLHNHKGAKFNLT